MIGLIEEHARQFAMSLVYEAAKHSQDPETHVGAVTFPPDFIHDPTNNKMLIWGCNHFPPGLTLTPEILGRPGKYCHIIHAEKDIVNQAEKFCLNLTGCLLFTNGLPCLNCAEAIISAGIAEIYFDEAWESFGDPGWQKTWQESKQAGAVKLQEAGIAVIPIRYQPKTPQERFKRGQRF